VATQNEVVVAVEVGHTVADAVEFKCHCFRQQPQKIDICGSQSLGVVMAPLQRALRDMPERRFVERLGDLTIMVALHADHIVRAYPGERFARIHPVIHQVASAVDRVGIAFARPDRFQCDDIAVNIGKDKRFHQGIGYQKLGRCVVRTEN
jgi:hypothetical protein